MDKFFVELTFIIYILIIKIQIYDYIYKVHNIIILYEIYFINISYFIFKLIVFRITNKILKEFLYFYLYKNIFICLIM